MTGLNGSKRRKWLTHYAPLVVWIVVILGLGGQIGSMNETSRFVRPLLEFLFPTASPETLTLVHGYIRKFAHFAEYAVLGILAFRAISQITGRTIKTACFAFFFAAMIASIDEFQQSFLPARTSSPIDVLIDLAGSAAAIMLCVVLSRDKQNQNRAKSSEP